MVSADYHPLNISQRVPSMEYAADVDHAGMGVVKIPAMVALDADGIIAAQSIASAVTTTSFAATYSTTAMGKYGRNVTVVASGAATSTVTVTGKDYLGQTIVETLTLSGTTPVLGLKAFKKIDSVLNGVTAAVTINVGWGNKLGLPYKVDALIVEKVSGAVPGNAGAIVAGNDTETQTATSADTRGTYAPHASFVPNGTRDYDLTCSFDRTNLHGYAQYSG